MRLLLRKAQEVKTLNQTIKQHLPKEWIAYCEVLSFNQGKLVLEIANSSWASKLRFIKDDLLIHLRSIPAFSGVSTISHVIRVHTEMAAKPQTTPKPTTRKIGKEALDSLKTFTEQTAQPELKQKLQQFLAHQQ